MNERDILAYHEAGHAAVGMALGMDILGGTITRAGNTLGSVSWQDSNDLTDADRLCMAVAGPIAEAQARRRSFRLSDFRQGSNLSDYQAILRLAGNLAPGSSEVQARLLKQQQGRAKNLLEVNAEIVNAIADALREANK